MENKGIMDVNRIVCVHVVAIIAWCKKKRYIQGFLFSALFGDFGNKKHFVVKKYNKNPRPKKKNKIFCESLFNSIVFFDGDINIPTLF